MKQPAPEDKDHVKESVTMLIILIMSVGFVVLALLFTGSYAPQIIGDLINAIKSQGNFKSYFDTYGILIIVAIILFTVYKLKDRSDKKKRS